MLYSGLPSDSLADATVRSALNANVTLYVPPSNTTDTTDSDSDSDESFYPGGPQFLTHVETFFYFLNIALFVLNVTTLTIQLAGE